MVGSNGPVLPTLAISPDEFVAFIRGRIELAKSVMERPARSEGSVMWLRTWDDFNRLWLIRHVGQEAADGYYPERVLFNPDPPPNWAKDKASLEFALVALITKQRVELLDRMLEFVPLWHVGTGIPRPRKPAAADESIFVVHGRNLSRAREVAKLVRKLTGRSTHILRELPNQGRTVLEKFEDYAGKAAFAVVVLTADDEGRLAGEPALRRRGRQNVIFELGFFYGMLGRDRVAVLVDPGVEHPSDVAGLAYTTIDARGDWQKELARELTAAGMVSTNG